MMPIMMANSGERVKVAKITGTDAIKQRLGELGFVVGNTVDVIQAQGGDMIVKVMDSKLALTRDMASKIMVEM